MTNPTSQPFEQATSLRIESAKIAWDETNCPRSIDFDDIYFSDSGAEFETEHVFLAANKLKQRWSTAHAQECVFCIGEIGFGTGLNFAKALQLWHQVEQKPQRLHYIAFEKHPLSLVDMQKAHANWPHLAQYFEQLYADYKPYHRSCHRFQLSADVILDLHLGDALESLQTLVVAPNTGIDCWFLDGFSPKQNQDLWSTALCRELVRISKPEATLSTYSAAGWVRKNLIEAGFSVSKTAGFANKRHMVSASLSPHPKQQSKYAWALPQALDHSVKTAIIVGAGLAGCTTANALARRGINVTVLDRAAAPASGASGIAQLALRPRLFNECNAGADYYLLAYLYALNAYQKLSCVNNECWYQTGVLQSTKAQNKKSPLNLERLKTIYHPKIVAAANEITSNNHAGLALLDDYLYFQTAGWLDPHAVCSNYLNHTNISTNFGADVESIQKTDTGWKCLSNTGKNYEADIVIIANSHLANRFSQTQHLPLHTVRGQATYINQSEKSAALRMVIMDQRSLFPAMNGRHTVSASYRRECDLTPSDSDNWENIQGLEPNFRDALDTHLPDVTAGVALRCSSKDFFPIVGMVANADTTTEYFKGLVRSAKASITQHDHYFRGLYISAAHGSNGAATCPLAAESIAGMVCNEPNIMSETMMAKTSSARFLIRDLKKQIMPRTNAGKIR